MSRKEKKQNPAEKGVLGRVVKYLFSHYKGRLTVVLICILFSAAANVSASVFLQRIVDTCITPALTDGFASVKTTLIKTVAIMGGVFGLADRKSVV